VSISYSQSENRQKPTGCRIKHHAFKSTQYSIKNNSTDRSVNHFYIDHTADTQYGGYVITTKDHLLKSTTGWSRFYFKLAPQEQVTFVVQEEASYENVISVSNFQTFITKTAPKLLERKVLKNEVLEQMKQMMKTNSLSSALQQIKSESYTDRVVLQWKETGSISESMLKKLDAVIEHQNSVAEITRKINSHEDFVKQVFQNQSRLRENIKSLEKVSNSALVERYLKDLNQEEDNLIKTRQAVDLLDKQKRAMETDIKNLKFTLSQESTKLLEALE